MLIGAIIAHLYSAFAMDWTIHGTGNQFFSFQNVQVALEVHPFFYLVVRGIFSSLGVKQLGHEADCLPVSCAQGKNDWNYTSAIPVYFHVVCRIFTFTFDMLIMWIFEIGHHDLPFCFHCTIMLTV
jgi:hypothetical protein